MKTKRTAVSILAVIIVVALLAGCTANAIIPELSTASISSARPSSPRVPLSTAEFGRLTYPRSYDDIARVLRDITSEWGEVRDGGYLIEEGTADAAVRESATGGNSSSPSAPSPTSAPAADGGEGGKDYSGTNTQVKGVDEGDIVKTDGDYIYILREYELIIALADGAGTKEISRTRLAEEKSDGNRLYGSDKYPTELYVSGDRLAVVSDKYAWDTRAEDKIGYYGGGSTVAVDIFDITSKSSPKFLAESGQDGYFTASRMIGDTLYLITNYNVWSIDSDTPETFVPALYMDGARELVSPDCIVICPPYNSTSYTVISTYDITTGEVRSNQSVLGGGNTVYMNGENLYVTRQEYHEDSAAPYYDEQYKVTRYTSKTTTLINRFSLSDGGVTLAASGTVSGYLLNQFSLDEYGGNLRVVTTINDYSYEIYEDEKRGWTNYKHLENDMSNSLYVLNSSLKTIGSITGLGEDERVYSVRFDGEIGYFVTFRETDPLFTVDLSDPSGPKVLSALKIPGFSQYLHVYGEGRLFGLGMDADPATGRTDGMKLSMFDTTDKTNVTEKHTLKLDSSYSEALYNHKAILISPDKNIIAFPADGGYDVYGYSDERGFYKLASIKGAESYWWSGNMRGLYIEDYAYICGTDGISVFDMTTFTGVKSVKF